MTIKFGAFPLKWMLIISSCLLSQLAEVSSVSLLLSTFELTESKATLQEDGSVCHFHFLYCHFVSSGDAKVYLFVFASSRGYGHWCVPFRQTVSGIQPTTCRWWNSVWYLFKRHIQLPAAHRQSIGQAINRPRKRPDSVCWYSQARSFDTTEMPPRESTHTKLPGYKHAHSCEDSLQGLLHHESDCKTTN